MVIGPGGAFWISTVSSFVQPISVQVWPGFWSQARETMIAANTT
jgi:hypothetical protein